MKCRLLTCAALLFLTVTARAQAPADIFAGKAFPSTLPAAQIDSTFHFVDLVDAQGKPGTYATKGQTVTIGSETLLVTYAVPLTVAITRPARPQPGSTATLALINLRFVQAMLNFREVPQSPDAASPVTPNSGGANGPPTPNSGGGGR